MQSSAWKEELFRILIELVSHSAPLALLSAAFIPKSFHLFCQGSFFFLPRASPKSFLYRKQQRLYIIYHLSCWSVTSQNCLCHRTQGFSHAMATSRRMDFPQYWHRWWIWVGGRSGAARNTHFVDSFELYQFYSMVNAFYFYNLGVLTRC